MLKKLIVLSSVALCTTAFAQKTYTVAKGDNPYNIAKKYGLSMAELEKLNPRIKSGKLAIGDTVKVSSKKDVPAAKKPATNDKPKTGTLGKVTVLPKQTLYGISRQYHLSDAEILKLNPGLDKGLKIGDEIILPAENIRKYGTSQAGVPQKTPLQAETPTASSDTYTVQQKDNYFQISKKFKLTQKQLFALNPGLEEKGLQPGTTIRIADAAPLETPVQTASAIPVQEPVKTSVADDYVTYTVQSGDTVFGITNKFGISLDDLLAQNPQLSSGLHPGMVLKIKKLEVAYIKNNDNALDVVLMLPFGFDASDTKYRTMAMDFLSGARLAIERNAGQGQKLNIKVIDAGNESSFKSSLTQINQNNTDLIIGPFFKSNILEVLKYVGDKKIPVVAPFANSAELFDYSNLILVQAEDRTFAERIAKEVTQIYSDQKIYIVGGADKTEANLVKSNLSQNLKNPNVTIIDSPSQIQADKNMVTGQPAPVIAILASDNEALGNQFGQKMIDLSSEVAGMRSFSTYYQPFFDKHIDELRKASLIYLADRKINMDGDFEKEILAAYKEKYCKTPAKYAIIGFDVVNDALTRENKKGEIFRQIGKSQTQLATKFEYVRTKPNGAYINTGYRVVRLVP